MAPSRSVRVFLSSTFRDFAEERDLLVRKIFPELRRRARERNVEVIDIDLRWGITPEQAEQGKVLPICLAEIDRARPYFVGFIGDRYGWVPEATQYDLSLLVEQPWLDAHRGGKSVTELEMLHGVLNNPAMAGRAFFYFRDTQYSQAKGGAYLSESEGHHAKLELLKTRIRESGFPVMEDYPSPEALAARVQEDLWRVIDEAFPVESVPDPVTLERRRHEVYGGARLGLYLGGEKYFMALSEAMEAAPFKPVLITGPSGGGKSALVANWVERYATAHPDAWVITHYLGSSADAADPVRMVYRIEREIAQVTGEEDKLEGDPNKILQHFPEWLSRANAFAEKTGREWIIVLDGMNHVSTRTEFNWWPSELPSRVKVVASCLDGEMQSVLKARMNPCEVVVHPLSAQDGCDLIRTYLSRFNKVLPKPDVERIVAHPLGGSPLFLRTIAEEMRVFGVHEQLQQRLGGYLECRSMGEVFAKVFERVEEDNRPEDMEAALSVLWAALESFAEDELVAVTGLAPAVWSSILNALEGSLISNGGRIAFGHDYLRKAVEDRYVASTGKQSAVMRKLSDFCSERMRSEGRKANSSYVRRQAVRHFIISEQWDEAVAALSDLEFIETRAKAKELNEMLGNYAQVINFLPEAMEKYRKTEDSKRAATRYGKTMMEYAAAFNRIRAGSEEPEPNLPNPIQTVRLWTRDEISLERSRIDCKPDRLMGLIAFQRFVSTNILPLSIYAKTPGFVANHACNVHPSGPVHAQGKRFLSDDQEIKILRQFPPRETYNYMDPIAGVLDDLDSSHSIAITPNGACAVSGSTDKSLRVWNLETGECMRSIKGHTGDIGAVVLTSDGRRAVSASSDKSLRVWDLETGECIWVLNGHTGTVGAVAITPDGSRVVSCSSDKTIRVWDLKTGECLRILEGHTDSVYGIDLTPDGRHAISSSCDSTIRIWDVDQGTCLKVHEGLADPFWNTPIVMAPDGGRWVFAKTDSDKGGVVIIVGAGKGISALGGHGNAVRALAITPDGFRIASASCDRTIRIWDAETGECQRILAGHTHEVISVAITPDGRKVVSGGDDRSIRIWEIETNDSEGGSEKHSGWINSLAVQSDLQTAVSASNDQTLRIWDLKTGVCQSVLEGHEDSISLVVIDAAGLRMASASDDHTLRIWNARTGKCLHILKGHTHGVRTISLSSDGLRAVSAGYDKNIRIWNLESGRCLRILKGHTGCVLALEASPCGQCVVSAGEDKSIRVWSLKTGKCLHELKGHTDRIGSVAISPDGKFAVSGSGDETLRVWDLQSGECLQFFSAYAGTGPVRLTPDALHAVSADADNSLRIWDIKAGKCLRVLAGHTDQITGIIISPDGRFIVSSSGDFTVRLWNFRSGECCTIIYLRGLLQISLDWKSRIVVAAISDGSVLFFQIKNFRLDPLITTAFFSGRFGNRKKETLAAQSACCGQFIDVPVALAKRIETRSKHVAHDACPDPKLVFSCPNCRTLLRANPFFVTSSLGGDGQ